MKRYFLFFLSVIFLCAFGPVPPQRDTKFSTTSKDKDVQDLPYKPQGVESQSDENAQDAFMDEKITLSEDATLDEKPKKKFDWKTVPYIADKLPELVWPEDPEY